MLRRFEGQWGIDRIAKQTWGNRKSYQSCVNNPSTYRGSRRQWSPSTSPSQSATARRERDPTPPRVRSPSAGPSQPQRPAPRRIISSDDEDDDDLMDFDDHNQQPDDDDEGEEESPKDPKGKKRAALGDGGAPRKRGRTD